LCVTTLKEEQAAIAARRDFAETIEFDILRNGVGGVALAVQTDATEEVLCAALGGRRCQQVETLISGVGDTSAFTAGWLTGQEIYRGSITGILEHSGCVEAR